MKKGVTDEQIEVRTDGQKDGGEFIGSSHWAGEKTVIPKRITQQNKNNSKKKKKSENWMSNSILKYYE